MRSLLVLSLAACGGGGKSPADVLYRGDVWGGNIAIADGNVYWTTYNEGGFEPNEIGLYVAPLDGSAEPRRLSVGSSHGVPGFGMTIAGGRAIWSGEIGNGESVAGVFADSIDGGPRTELARFSSGEAPRGIAFNDGFVYASGAELLKIPLDGSGPATVLDAAGGYEWMVGRGDDLIVERGGQFELIDLITTQRRTIGSAGLTTGNFDVDNDDLYIPTGDTVTRMDRETGAITRLAVGGEVRNVAVARDTLYVARSLDDGIELVKLPITGGQPELVLPDVFVGVGELAVGGGSVAFAGCSCGPVGGGNGVVGRVPL